MIYRCFVFFICFLGFHNQVHALKYKVGVEDLSYYPLYDFNAIDNTRPSFAHDLLTAFFNKYDIQFEFVALPIKRFDKWYVERGIDFKFPDNVRWRSDKENKLGITFSRPVLDLVAGTYVKSTNAKFDADNITKLVTMQGFYPTLWIDKIAEGNTKLIEESSPLAVVKHLLEENAQGTNIDMNVIKHQLKKLGKENQIVLAEGIYHQNFSYHFSSINYPEIIAQFNEFLNENQDFLRQLKQKYHIMEPSEPN